MALLLIKQGLRTTLYQKKQLSQHDNILQIINVNNNHWALISTFGCTDSTVKLYDSISGSEIINVIASVFRFQTQSFTVKVKNVAGLVGPN